MKITASDKIIIQGADPLMIKAIKKKLTLPNPMFWKLKRMGKWIGGTPRDFIYYKAIEDGLIIPRGLLSRTKRFFPDIEVLESFVKCHLTQNLPSIALRSYQNDIMTHFCSQKLSEGIFNLSVGSGKTILALEIIRELGLTTTILVNTSVIQDQFVDEMKKHWNYKSGIINGKNKEIKEITIANIASLFNNQELLKKLVENTSILITDECHLYLSDKRVEVLEQFRPSHIFGLSGTPIREDGQSDAIPFYFGDVIEKYELTMISPTVEIIDPRENIPVRLNYAEMIDYMICNESRNRLIAGIALGEATQGRKVLVLVKRVEHYRKIYEWLPNWDSIIIAESSDDKLGNKLNLLRENQMNFSIILGTFSLLSTGFNIEKLDTLILAGDLKSEILTMQSSGRILRLLKEKTAKIIDIADMSNPILKRQHYARKKLYEKKGWKIKTKWD